MLNENLDVMLKLKMFLPVSSINRIAMFAPCEIVSCLEVSLFDVKKLSSWVLSSPLTYGKEQAENKLTSKRASLFLSAISHVSFRPSK